MKLICVFIIYFVILFTAVILIYRVRSHITFVFEFDGNIVTLSIQLQKAIELTKVFGRLFALTSMKIEHPGE